MSSQQVSQTSPQCSSSPESLRCAEYLIQNAGRRSSYPRLIKRAHYAIKELRTIEDELQSWPFVRIRDARDDIQTSVRILREVNVYARVTLFLSLYIYISLFIGAYV